MGHFKIQHIINLKNAVKFVFDSSRKWAFANLLLTIVGGILPLIIIYLTKLIIDKVTGSINVSDKALAFAGILFIIVVTGIVFLINEIIGSLSSLAREQQSQIASDHIFDILHKKSTELDIEYYENPDYHDILHRARIEAPFRPPRIVNNIILVFQNSISLVLTAGILFYFHWSIALVLFMAVVPGIFIRVRFAEKLFLWSKAVTPSERKVRYFNWILTSEKFVKEIRLYNLGPLLINRFRDIRTLLRNEKLKILFKRTTIELVTQVTSTIAIFGCYVFVAYKTIYNEITIGDMVLFFLAFQKGFSYLRDVLSSLAGLYEDNLFLSSFYDFLALKPQILEPVTAKVFPERIEKGIEFCNVDFAYPSTNKVFLKNINIKIGSGETIAIVGDNGAGKTSLIKLLCRLYEPLKGSILIDGINIKDFANNDLRKNISVLFQDFSQYNISAKENISFGDLTTAESFENIEEASKNAGIYELIDSFPEKYDTILGTIFDNSKELSIGEWQKVALARAFYRQAPIIILDEPTSSMDAQAEYEFFNNFKLLARGKTAIIVSHRFSTIKMADRIYVLSDESILESGTHNELMTLNGRYAHLYNLQASNYH